MSLNLQAQNGWQSYSIPSPGGGSFHFMNANTGIVVGQHKYYRTTNGMASWNTYNTPDTASSTHYGSVIFINEQTGWLKAVSIAGPISFYFMHRTTDAGETFGPLVQVGASNDMQFINDNTGYMASGELPMFITQGDIQKTTNGGYNWTSLYWDCYLNQDISFINEQTGWVYGYYADDVGTFIHRIVKTTNGGSNWTVLLRDSTTGFSPYRNLNFFDSNTGYLIMNPPSGLRKTTDGGTTWSSVDTTAYSGNYIRNYFFLNKDTGWVTTGPTGKIFRTNDGGINWNAQHTGQSSITGKIYFINSLTGWAQVNSTTILRTTTGGVTSIQNISTEIPDKFSLHQNYPNPFNPTTSIRFDLPKQGFVSLKVFDISGREVAELVKEELQPGVYEYGFDGTGLGSGVYLYKLQSGDFVETRRMVLVK